MQPTIIFNSQDELETYIYQFIITNNNNEIIAVQHNNIESNLSYFIRKAPRNYNRASIIGTAALYVAGAEECMLIFSPTATGSIQLTNNRWNEWVIVNRTTAEKQLVGGVISSYLTPTNVVRTFAPAVSVLHLAKGNNNQWYQINSETDSSVLCAAFGAGTLFITGGNLDVDKIYYNDNLVSNLTVFYNAGSRYLIPTIEWDYVLDENDVVIGVKILLPQIFTYDDIFVIAPNPSCDSGGGGTSSGKTSYLQFKVGDANSYVGDILQSSIQFPVDGDRQMIINVANVEDDSILVFSNNGLLPRDLTDVDSYGRVYEPSRVIINRYPSFVTNQLVIIQYKKL